MRLLLDTGLVLWAMADDARLSAAARDRMQAADAVHVSAVSMWEIAIKAALGKLDADVDELTGLLPHAGFLDLPVTFEHARALRGLPNHHRDPFDRMLVAQAISEPLRLLTSDRTLARYGDLVDVV